MTQPCETVDVGYKLLACYKHRHIFFLAESLNSVTYSGVELADHLLDREFEKVTLTCRADLEWLRLRVIETDPALDVQMTRIDIKKAQRDCRRGNSY